MRPQLIDRDGREVTPGDICIIERERFPTLAGHILGTAPHGWLTVAVYRPDGMLTLTAFPRDVVRGFPNAA